MSFYRRLIIDVFYEGHRPRHEDCEIIIIEK